LPGCERAALLAAGTIDERNVQVDHLQRAEAVAVLSSVRGWCDAVLIDLDGSTRS
jgi:branched-subunit amino acid aminotransferase/4-amino-4-deoxychorismate lyase